MFQKKSKLKKVVSIVLALIFFITTFIIDSPNGVANVNAAGAGVKLQGHSQNIGWHNGFVENGVMTVGTEGQSLRLEAVKMKINYTNNGSGFFIQTGDYYAQNVNCNEWSGVIGTEGQSRPLYYVAIRLWGPIANEYDVVYRVHIQDYGWSDGWVKNGQLAGRPSEGKRVEKLQVKLVKKNSKF